MARSDLAAILMILVVAGLVLGVGLYFEHRPFIRDHAFTHHGREASK